MLDETLVKKLQEDEKKQLRQQVELEKREDSKFNRHWKTKVDNKKRKDWLLQSSRDYKTNYHKT